MSPNSSSLTPTATVADVPPTSRVWPRIVLLAVAGFESLIGSRNLAKLLICTTPLSRLGNLSSMPDLPFTPSLQSARLCSPLSVIFVPLSLCLPPTFWRPGSQIADYCAVRHRMGLVTGRTVAVGAATDLSAARCGSDRSCPFGQAFMAWRNFRRPAIGKSAFRRDHFYDRDHDLRILTATRRSKSGVP